MAEKIFYITKEKLLELQKEYDELTAAEHSRAIKEEAPKMLESEDISAEFISFQEDMTSLRSRIEELKDILDHRQIIGKPSRDRQEVVDLGAKVHLDAAGKNDEFLIVGTLEADPNLGKISNESPVGKALLGHKIGDEILVSEPVKKKYKIKKITYEIS